MVSSNPYCKVLGIKVPDLAIVKDSRDANYYALLIVVLLEKGSPVTLWEAALRFDEAGVAPVESALASLKRCRPGRSPIYRDGDIYALDPHDTEADLWMFRLGLRPPKRPSLSIVRPNPEPLPDIDSPLTVKLLDEAWRDGVPGNFSAQRLAVCVLDANGKDMLPDDVVSFVTSRSSWSLLSVDSAEYWRRGAPVIVREDGRWELNPEHDALRSARTAVCKRIEMVRRSPHNRTPPSVVAANQEFFKNKRKKHADELARMSRILLYAFPANKPEAIVLIDVGKREIETFLGTEMTKAVERLSNYEIIAAVDVRRLLRILDFDPSERLLGELGPPQKTMRLNKQGRVLRITTSLLIYGSCGISNPFGDEKKLRCYLKDRKITQLCRRLEANAKSLFSYYQYGRLHGSIRLRWGFLDEQITAPWVHRDEERLYSLMDQAYESNAALEVVVGNAPGWADPWSQMVTAFVEKELQGWHMWLVDDDGNWINEDEIQLARLIDRRGF